MGAQLLGGASPSASGAPVGRVPIAVARSSSLTTVGDRQRAVTATTPQPLPTTVSTTPSTVLVWDETFADNRHGWPDNSSSTAWLIRGGYHLEPRHPGQFVTVGPSPAIDLRDTQVTATFRKLGGPPGGTYGIVVRDQSSAAHDGLSQSGHYYVLGIGDLGEVGIWRLDDDHWVDLVGRRPSSAVRRGTAENELVARTEGARLTLTVNGTEAAQVVDSTLQRGSVGVYVGGDGDRAALLHLRVEQIV